MKLRVIFTASSAFAACVLGRGAATDEGAAALQSSPTGVRSAVGVTSFSAKWSAYGAYLHKMFYDIQTRWDKILANGGKEPPSGTHVSVKFRINAKGQVTEIVDVEGTSDVSGKKACVAAVTLSAPYDKWTDDMIDVLGTSQVLTLVFTYQ
jgi:hypothetical protein